MLHRQGTVAAASVNGSRCQSEYVPRVSHLVDVGTNTSDQPVPGPPEGGDDAGRAQPVNMVPEHEILFLNVRPKLGLEGKNSAF